MSASSPVRLKYSLVVAPTVVVGVPLQRVECCDRDLVAIRSRSVVVPCRDCICPCPGSLHTSLAAGHQSQSLKSAPSGGSGNLDRRRHRLHIPQTGLPLLSRDITRLNKRLAEGPAAHRNQLHPMCDRRYLRHKAIRVSGGHTAASGIHRAVRERLVRIGRAVRLLIKFAAFPYVNHDSAIHVNHLFYFLCHFHLTSSLSHTAPSDASAFGCTARSFLSLSPMTGALCQSAARRRRELTLQQSPHFPTSQRAVCHLNTGHVTSMAAARYHCSRQHPTLAGPHTKDELYLLVERGCSVAASIGARIASTVARTKSANSSRA